jgi:hypothetical protein
MPISSMFAKFAEIPRIIGKSYERTYQKLNFEAQRLAFGFDLLKGPQPANVEYLIAAAALHTLRTDFSVLRH